MPDGFSITTFASNVPNARQIARGDNGTVFVGSRRVGSVYAVVDSDGDFIADDVHIVAKDLFLPTGIAFHDGNLYVAEVNRVIAFDGIESRLTDPPSPRIVVDGLPSDKHHGWKFLGFGPDGHLYIPVGAPCNVCEVVDPYGTILQFNMQTKALQVYARGVRNSVGFDWHPLSKKMWFSDNGRDWMGDDVPGCELNRVDTPESHFGFPFVHAVGIADDQFSMPDGLTDIVAPAKVLEAHVAPLGVMFYTGAQFPESYQNALFVAEHGSWNRSKKSGYRIMVAHLDDAENVISYRPFITGWKVGEANWGRPVDLQQLPDGSILISDDYAGVIYRVQYSQ